MNLREHFEKWYRTQNKVFQDTFNKAEKGERDRYYYDRVESGWQGFQSGHAAGLERAAGICNDASDEYDADFENGRALAATKCMNDILRAMKEPK